MDKIPKALLFVEDENDQFTFEAIIEHLGLADQVEVEWIAIPKENNPEKPTGLIKALSAKKNALNKGNYDRVGIIYDIDQSPIEDLLKTINTALQAAYPEAFNRLTQQNQFVDFTFIEQSINEEYKVGFACHFVGLNNTGEIEDLLKEAALKPAPLAHCVEECLIECLNAQGQVALRTKDLVKLWINNYIRYDTLDKNKRNAKHTQWENVMKERQKKEQLFNFEHEAFDELKKFLIALSQNR
jgi:hypothetical protein